MIAESCVHGPVDRLMSLSLSYKKEPEHRLVDSQLGQQWTKIILKCLQDWGKKEEINFK